MVAESSTVPHAAAVPPVAGHRARRSQPKAWHSTLDPEARPTGLPAPWDTLAWSQLAPFRNRTKARVFVAQYEGRLVVCKDGSLAVRSLFTGWFRRWSLRNEVRALRVLDGLPGVPRLLAAWPAGLVMEHVPGRLLTDLRRTPVPAEVFDRLDELLAAVHARGVAILDLHRRNILVDEQGRVSLIDFELATHEREGLLRGFVRRGQRLDRLAAARQRRAFGAPLREEQQALLDDLPAWYRFTRRLKRWRSRIRRR